MTSPATLQRVAVETTRQLAGAVISDERKRLRLSQVRAAELWGISRPTLARLEGGHDVSDAAFRYIEGALKLPRHFFAFVLAGDRDRISSLAGLDEDLRQFVLYELAVLMQRPRRRATDR